MPTLNMSQTTPTLIAIALASTLLCCSGGLAPGDAAHATEAAEARPLPEFAVQDLEGDLFTSESLHGKVALVNFWATWCGPCKIEMPWFVDFQRKYKDKGFTVLAISLDEDGWEPVREFAAEFELNFPVALGDDPLAMDFGGVHALPTTMIVNREGNIVTTHTGLVPKRTYETEIEALL